MICKVLSASRWAMLICNSLETASLRACVKTTWCCSLLLWYRTSSSLINNFASCCDSCWTSFDSLLLFLGDNLAGCFRISFTLDIQYYALCPFLMSSIVKHLSTIVKSSKIFVCSLIAVLRQTAAGSWFSWVKSERSNNNQLELFLYTIECVLNEFVLMYNLLCL